MHHLESGGIVIMDGKVLLRKTAKHEWLFPKGHVEHGENLQQAAEREIKEETGILSKATDYLGKIGYTFKGDNYEVHFFLMQPLGNTETWFQHRNVDSFLFPPDEALNLLTFDSYKEQLALALDKTKKWSVSEKAPKAD